MCHNMPCKFCEIGSNAEKTVFYIIANSTIDCKGCFAPPFQTEEELRALLRPLYKNLDLHTDGSMVYFHCTK